MVRRSGSKRQWELFSKWSELIGTLLLLAASCIAAGHRLHAMEMQHAAPPAAAQAAEGEPLVVCVLHILGHGIIILMAVVVILTMLRQSAAPSQQESHQEPGGSPQKEAQ